MKIVQAVHTPQWRLIAGSISFNPDSAATNLSKNNAVVGDARVGL